MPIMLNLNSFMIGSKKPQVMAEFYQKVFGRKADMIDGDWHGWAVGNGFLTVGGHSEVKDSAVEPQRLIFNFETTEVQKEFDRITGLGATVIKAPYQMGAMWIATLADPDGNYFQLLTPWSDSN